MLLLGLMAVPVSVGLAVLFFARGRLEWRDLGQPLAVGVALMVIGFYLFRWIGVQDYEVWNGRVARMDTGTTGCCHDYECNCRQECSGSGDQRTCTNVCSVCYLHSYDEYWRAESSNDERVYWNTCNSPGTETPVEWLAIRIGEPTAWEHRYSNYVLAAPDELVAPALDAGRYVGRVPAYPRPEGWEARRLLFVGMPDPADAGELDEALDELNADLGAKKQVNLIIVVVREADRGYFAALRAAWLGGKKNDVVLVIGAPEFPDIRWARVMAWNSGPGDGAIFREDLSGRIEALGVFDGAAVLAALREEVVRGYERRPFAELAGMMARAKPPGWAVVLLVFLGMGVTAGLTGRAWDRRQWAEILAARRAAREAAQP